MGINTVICSENQKSEFYAPVRTSKYEREIPALPVYRSTTVQMLMAGTFFF